jgi:hypothetical protein
MRGKLRLGRNDPAQATRKTESSVELLPGVEGVPVPGNSGKLVNASSADAGK